MKKNYPTNTGSVSAVIGTQWGDEGKGKVIDAISCDYDIVARAAGGANAGHTIYINGDKHVFHLLPSGALHEKINIVLGTGMVIHLPTLLDEIATLKDIGIDVLPRLKISARAHIVMEYHKLIDSWNESQREKSGTEAIGTTHRGIGPAYADKINRLGLRVESLLNPESWQKSVEMATKRIHTFYGIEVDTDKELVQLTQAAEMLKTNICDTEAFLDEALLKDKNVLIEGAQATLLDIDHGSYPFVTSSATTIAGALQGLGIAPAALNGNTIGVVKAYCTRVGNGTFPTECDETTGDRIRESGGEYGATTGRPRRCGWFDLVALKKTVRINGLTDLALTKLDVLDNEAEVKVCTGYTSDDTVQYKTFKGWQSTTASLTSYEKLPAQARAFIEHIENEIGIPVSYIGTGKEREALIVRG